MLATAPLTHGSSPALGAARGQWSGASVPAVLRPACWWALLIGAPPAPSH